MKVGEDMLNCIKVTIENNPFAGGIEINAEANGTKPSTVTSIKIRRKEAAGSSWMPITTIDVEDKENIGFAMLDITSKSNDKYSYIIDVMAGNNIYETQTFSNIECNFDGLFIGDAKNQFLAVGSCETSIKRITKVEYVSTLSGRTPYRISNSDLNYTTGKSSGYFFELDLNNRPMPDYNHKYSNEVIDFLTNGTTKILKTGDGQVWCVSIDGVVELPFHDYYIGANNISFDWTEIGDLIPYGVVMFNE